MTVLRQVLYRHRPILSSYGLVAVLLLIVGVLRPGFASPDQVRIWLIEASIIGLVALGQTFVILTGGVDLSIPWTLTTVATMLTVLTQGHNAPLVWAIPAVLTLALAIGLGNGLGVAFFGISPVVMTLGTNAILEGALVGYTSGGRPGAVAPPAVEFLVQGRLAGMPVDLVLWGVIIAGATIVLSFSILGRRIYAVGNNPVASAYSGVSVRQVQTAVYMVSAFAAGLAGIVLTGRVGSSYLGMGDLYLFASVAAVAIGGASILGGSGHYLGTVAGALTLTLISGLLPMLNVSASAEQILYGVIVLGTVLISRGRRE